MKVKWLAAYGFCSLISLSWTARADVIGAPAGCPPGARGETSHVGDRCLPATCSSNRDCRGIEQCRPYRVCTKRSTVPNHCRGLSEDCPPTHEEELVVMTCEISAQCRGHEEPLPPIVGTLAEGPASCRESTVCVLPQLPPLPSPTTPPVAEQRDGGCANCSTASERKPLAATAVLVSLFALLVIRVRWSR